MAPRSVEVLMGKKASPDGEAMLHAIIRVAKKDGDSVSLTNRYHGKSEILVLFGVGFSIHHEARKRQVGRGKTAVLFDLGYFRKAKEDGYVRFSINQDHPQHLIAKAPLIEDRLDVQGIKLKNVSNPNGPILLIGLGRKSRKYLGEDHWEENKLRELQRRFPNRQIIHRPKPKQDFPKLSCERDIDTPIEKLLVGASLVVCRHSNVAIDATIAGVPFETQDGAAVYLGKLPFSSENRREFLIRLCWFQWAATEANQAWKFIKGMI